MSDHMNPLSNCPKAITILPFVYRMYFEKGLMFSQPISNMKSMMPF